MSSIGVPRLGDRALAPPLTAGVCGAILKVSATLLLAVKWMGTAYPIYTGIKMLLANGEVDEVEDKSKATSRRAMKLFSQGLTTQLSNPKALVFFTALRPTSA